MRTIDYAQFIIPQLKENVIAGMSYRMQIINFMREQVQNKHLKPGDLVPPYRRFARDNGVHPNTVCQTYGELKRMGILQTIDRSRTCISWNLNPTSEERSHFSEGTTDPPPLPVSMQAPAAPRLLQNYFNIGIDRPRLSNLTKPNLHKFLTHMVHKEIGKYQSKLLGDLHGQHRLPMVVREHLRISQQLIISDEELTMIRGRRASLNRVFRALTSPEGAAINTQPQDPVARSLLSASCARVCELSSAAPNFISRLEHMLEETSIELLYIRAQCSYPEGYTLCREDGIRLLELSKKHRFYIVDEMEDHEFWHEKTVYECMATLPHDGHLVLLYGLSKLSPELEEYRLVCARKALISLLQDGLEDPASQIYMNDLAVLGMIEDGTLRKIQLQINKTARQYLQSLDQMLSMQLSEYIDYSIPQCGLSLWIHFPEDLDLKIILERLSEGHPKVEVPYQPALQYTIRPVHYMRLGFGPLNLQEGLLPAQKLPVLIADLRNSDRKNQAY